MKKAIIISLLLTCVIAVEGQTLREALAPYFPIGCAVNASIVADTASKANKVVRTQFSAIVPENCMKGAYISPEEGVWNWTEPDRFVDFGERNNMLIIGHCLIWHSQTAPWIFTDKKGNPVSRKVLIARMKNYIYTVVGRYKGRIYGWDVCNECFEDDGTLRDSPWRQIIGDDYIALAYQFAHEADPDAELYYNDYSVSSPAKCAAICKLVSNLKAKGLRIDAVGMQSHNGLTWPCLADYDRAMTMIAATGAQVIISELDMNVLPNPDSFSGAEVSQFYEYSEAMDPYRRGMPREVRDQINERWLAFFLLYRQHAADINRVTLWGVGDRDSWLNDWPIPGRHADALLFDRKYNPKPVISQIITLYE